MNSLFYKCRDTYCPLQFNSHEQKLAHEEELHRFNCTLCIAICNNQVDLDEHCKIQHFEAGSARNSLRNSIKAKYGHNNPLTLSLFPRQLRTFDGYARKNSTKNPVWRWPNEDIAEWLQMAMVKGAEAGRGRAGSILFAHIVYMAIVKKDLVFDQRDDGGVITCIKYANLDCLSITLSSILFVDREQGRVLKVAIADPESLYTERVICEKLPDGIALKADDIYDVTVKSDSYPDLFHVSIVEMPKIEFETQDFIMNHHPHDTSISTVLGIVLPAFVAASVLHPLGWTRCDFCARNSAVDPMEGGEIGFSMLIDLGATVDDVNIVYDTAGVQFAHPSFDADTGMAPAGFGLNGKQVDIVSLVILVLFAVTKQIPEATSLEVGDSIDEYFVGLEPRFESLGLQDLAIVMKGLLVDSWTFKGEAGKGQESFQHMHRLLEEKRASIGKAVSWDV